METEAILNSKLNLSHPVKQLRAKYHLKLRLKRSQVRCRLSIDSSIFSQIKDGSQPRKLYVVVPHLDADSVPVPNVVTAGAGSVVGRPTIAACVRDPVESQQRELYSLGSKEPVYENGNYRLNFYGRVSHPSVKNFQIVSVDDPDDIICQFGKVGDDKFHLDFKAPISPFQAFGIALTQFNI